MIQPQVLSRQETAVIPWAVRPERKKVPGKGSLDVLERAASDPSFIAQLTHNSLEALVPYDLTWREKAALLSGDVRWIEAHVGKLSARLRTWLECRLEQEVW
jgi:hypothetical protein